MPSKIDQVWDGKNKKVTSIAKLKAKSIQSNDLIFFSQRLWRALGQLMVRFPTSCAHFKFLPIRENHIQHLKGAEQKTKGQTN